MDKRSPYNGQVVKCIRQGYGKYDYPETDQMFSYEGDWHVGVKNSKHGKFTIRGVSEYVGEFKDGEISGVGERRWVDGRVYRGEWVIGEMCGKGRLANPRLDESYEGDFLKNQRHGKGTYRKGKETFQGEFRNHKVHGPATYLLENNFCLEGSFEGGFLQGQSIVNWHKKASYEGTFSKCIPIGHSIFTTHDASYLFAGNYVDGMPALEEVSAYVWVKLDRSEVKLILSEEQLAAQAAAAAGGAKKKAPPPAGSKKLTAGDAAAAAAAVPAVIVKPGEDLGKITLRTGSFAVLQAAVAAAQAAQAQALASVKGAKGAATATPATATDQQPINPEPPVADTSTHYPELVRKVTVRLKLLQLTNNNTDNSPAESVAGAGQSLWVRRPYPGDVASAASRFPCTAVTVLNGTISCRQHINDDRPAKDVQPPTLNLDRGAESDLMSDDDHIAPVVMPIDSVFELTCSRRRYAASSSPLNILIDFKFNVEQMLSLMQIANMVQSTMFVHVAKITLNGSAEDHCDLVLAIPRKPVVSRGRASVAGKLPLIEWMWNKSMWQLWVTTAAKPQECDLHTSNNNNNNVSDNLGGTTAAVVAAAGGSAGECLVEGSVAVRQGSDSSQASSSESQSHDHHHPAPQHHEDHHAQHVDHHDEHHHHHRHAKPHRATARAPKAENTGPYTSCLFRWHNSSCVIDDPNAWHSLGLSLHSSRDTTVSNSVSAVDSKKVIAAELLINGHSQLPMDQHDMDKCLVCEDVNSADNQSNNTAFFHRLANPATADSLVTPAAQQQDPNNAIADSVAATEGKAAVVTDLYTLTVGGVNSFFCGSVNAVSLFDRNDRGSLANMTAVYSDYRLQYPGVFKTVISSNDNNDGFGQFAGAMGAFGQLSAPNAAPAEEAAALAQAEQAQAETDTETVKSNVPEDCTVALQHDICLICGTAELTSLVIPVDTPLGQYVVEISDAVQQECLVSLDNVHYAESVRAAASASASSANATASSSSPAASTTTSGQSENARIVQPIALQHMYKVIRPLPVNTQILITVDCNRDI